MKAVFVKLFYVCLIVLSISCSNNSDEYTARSVDPEALRISLDDITPSEPNIDTNDLSFLPYDDGGGEHTAFPHKNTIAPYGHYLYTPSEYLTNEYDYPLLIFLHGWTPENYDSSINPVDLEGVLIHGPPQLIEINKWNPNHPFIVASPQLIEQYWSYDKIHSFIGYLIDAYRINKKRIYITGLSLGGGGAWHYIAEMGDESYAAAIVPICASYYPSTADSYKNTPVWAFHGENDTTVDPFTNGGSVQMVAAINQINPTVRAKITLYPNTGHDSWTRTYNGLGMGTEDKWYNKFDTAIYDWMLQYKKE